MDILRQQLLLAEHSDPQYMAMTETDSRIGIMKVIIESSQEFLRQNR
jgi:hypothetical protein